MKYRITDALQIMAAILLTGGLLASASPLPQEAPSQNNQATIAQQQKAPEPAIEPAPAVAEPKAVTWQDNPNKCNQATQYIAEHAPFGCIDKPAASAAPAPRTLGGNKNTWLAASGIPADQWWAVDYIVSREAGWDPCAYNPGRSNCSANPTTACGLAQSLPCGKQAKYGHWTDPVANLKWQYDYVKAKYGGYPQAVAYWKTHHNY